MSQADYDRAAKSPLQHHHSAVQNGNIPFKPVPPPKPKNYRPMIPSNGNPTNGNMPNQWDTTVRIELETIHEHFGTFFNIFTFYCVSLGWFSQSKWILLSSDAIALPSTAITTTTATTSDAK